MSAPLFLIIRRQTTCSHTNRCQGPKNRVLTILTDTGMPAKRKVSNHLGTYTITSISRVAKNSIKLFVYVTIPPVFADMALTITRMNTDTYADSVEG